MNCSLSHQQVPNHDMMSRNNGGGPGGSSSGSASFMSDNTFSRPMHQPPHMRFQAPMPLLSQPQNNDSFLPQGDNFSHSNDDDSGNAMDPFRLPPYRHT